MKLIYTIFLLAIVSYGCMPNPIQSEQVLTTSPTKIFSTQIATLAPTQTQQLSSEVKQRCLLVQEQLPKGETLPGFLIVDSRIYTHTKEGVVFKLDLQSLQKELLIKADQETITYPNSYTISPDGRWYLSFKKNAANETQLYIASVDEKPQLSRYWDNLWGDTAFWINNHQIFITPNAKHKVAIVLNPFSGEWQELKSEFPNPLNISFPYFYYNSTLSQVVYNSGDNYILWDANSDSNYWIKQTYDVYRPPVWSPDGKHVIMAVLDEQTSSQTLRDELVLVDTNGNETQLTNFTSLLPKTTESKINSFAWSLDNSHIAFILTTKVENNNTPKSSLLMIDISSKQIVDFCLEVYPGNIVWSPEGDKLAVNIPKDIKRFAGNNYQPEPDNTITAIVDITKNLIFKISDTVVVGWMR